MQSDRRLRGLTFKIAPWIADAAILPAPAYSAYASFSCLDLRVSQHDELEAPQVTQLHEYLPPHGQSGRAAALERRWAAWKQPKIFVAVAVAHVQCGAWVDQVGKQQVHSPAVLRLHPRQGRVPIHGRIVQNRAERERAGELVVQLLTQDAIRKDPLRGVSRQRR